MDFMVYVREDLGERIKKAKEEHGLNYSRLFQNAAEAELDRLDQVSEVNDEAEEFEFDLATPDGQPYKGVLRGKQLTEERDGVTFFLTDDGRVMCHDEKRRDVSQIESAGEARNWQSMDEYIAVSAALGETARVEL
jgi:hypothetical protein